MIGFAVMALRFGCELAALAALAWWGRSIHLALAIAAPLATCIVWGLWVAPRGRHRLRDPLRFAVESIVWLAAIAGLIAIDHLPIAIGLGVLAFATAVGARSFEPEVRSTDGSSRGRA